MSGGKTYAELKAELLRRGRLFEDLDFPASERSLNPKGTNPSNTPIRWRRPTEISRNPEFITKGATRFDLDQGELGDCWFVAASACLAVTNKKLFERVVPHDQDFDQGYAGIFRFRFWRFEKWIEVVIDDRLPTSYGRLVYASNLEQPHEYWAALLEKAYAKLNGSYEAIIGGHANDALVDFTGGVSETIDLKDPSKLPLNFYDTMERTTRMNSMMSCSIEGKSLHEEPIGNGLYRSHAYAITAIAQIEVRGKKHKLLRLLNPWGRDEWTGAWSDRSEEWRTVSDQDKRDLGLVPRDDGEFWMAYDDWLSNFEELRMCHLAPDALTEEIAIDMNKKSWEVIYYHSEWMRGLNAGGCGNPPHEDIYWTNPQFHLRLEDAYDPDGDKRCTIIVSLLTKRPDRGQGINIGYSIKRVRWGVRPLPDGKNYESEDVYTVVHTPVYTNVREKTGRHPLPTDCNYVVIPSTFYPNKESPFLLRVFTEVKVSSNEVDEPTVITTPETPEDVELAIFKRHAGEDFRLDSEELKNALDDFLKSEIAKPMEFELETARAMLALLDVDESGYLSLEEFKAATENIRKWLGAFDKLDRDGLGFVDTYELDALFKSLKIQLSRQVLKAIVRRFGGRKRQLSRRDFIYLVAKLVKMYGIFKKNTSGETMTVSKEEFLALTLQY